MHKNRQTKSKFYSNKAQDVGTRIKIESPKGTRRDEPHFPINLRTRVSKIHTPNLTLEKKGRKKRGREGDARERQCLVCAPAREKRERVGEGIFMPTNSRTKRLNYP